MNVTAGADSAALTWTPVSGASRYTVSASPGGQTATVGPYAASATVAGLAAGTAHTFTATATKASGSTALGPTSAVTPGNQATYSYDAAGNMAGTEADGLTTANTFNADEELTQSVTGPATTTYAYDTDGDQTTAGNDTFTWDGAGELSGATTTAGTFTYGYDSAGNLATTSLNGTKVQGTTWDTNAPLPLAAEDTTGTGATSADYAYGPDGLATVTTPASTYYPVTDWLGSLTGLTGSTGAQVTATSYSPYGTPSSTSLTSGAPSPSIGYAGSYALPGADGLDDMRARDYSPATGAFTSVDPDLTATGTPYAYAQDDPAALTDPAGLCSALASAVPDVGLALLTIVNIAQGGLDPLTDAAEAIALTDLADTTAEDAGAAIEGLEGPFYRRGYPAAQNLPQQVEESGELWGQSPRNNLGDVPRVKAYRGSLPANSPKGSFEFYTPAAPRAAGYGAPPDEAVWFEGDPGVRSFSIDGIDWAAIPATITTVLGE